MLRRWAVQKADQVASLLPLLGHPLKMSRERFVTLKCSERIELAGEGHFVVLPMNAAMAQPANEHALLQISLFKVPLEMRSAVYFFGDEVVEGERHPAMTASAGLRHG